MKSDRLINFRSLAFLLGIFLALAPSAFAVSTNTWVGGTGNNFSTTGNWMYNSGSGPVATGDSLIFAAAGSTTPNNDETAFTYGGITFSSGAQAYTISGNAFTNGGNITVSSANAQIINNNITLNGNRSVTATSGPLTLGGNISDDNGTRVLTANGASGKTLTLSGVNTYGGGTIIASGTVSINSPSALGSGTAITMANGASSPTLQVSAGLTLSSGLTITAGNATTKTVLATFANPTASTTFEVDSKITGANGNVKSGSNAGTVRLANDTSDYATFQTGYGTTEFTSVANAGSPSALGNGSGGGIGNTTYVIGNSSSGATFRYVGTGSTTTTRAIDWQGTTGALGLDSSSGSGSVKFLATGNLKSGSGSATLTLQGTNTGPNTLAQVINDSSGTTTLAKSGVGTWILTGANTFGGTTTISAGTLLVNNTSGSATSSGSVTVQNTATLGGGGSISGTVNVSAGGILSPGTNGVGSIGTLTLANAGATALTLNGNTIKCDLSTNTVTATSDLIAITGTLVVNGANTIALSFPNGSAPAGIYTLLTYGATNGSGTFALDRTYPNATLTVSTTNVTLNVTGAGTAAPLTWVGDGTANAWDTTTANWTNGSAAVTYADPAQVKFDDTGSASPAINIASPVNPASMTVNTSANSYIIGGAAIGGAGGLTKSGTTVLALTSSNAYSGGTTINAGTLTIIAANCLGNGTVINFGSSSTATLSLAAAATNTVQIPGTITITNYPSVNCNFGNLAGATTNFDIAAKITGTGNVKASTGSSSLNGAVRFSNDANNYTGSFNTGRGLFEFTSVANAGSPSALGAGSGSYAIVNGLSYVSLRYAGSGNTSTTRGIDWQGTGGGLTLDNTGSGSVQYLATGNLRSGTGASSLTLQGTNTGVNTLAQVINDATDGGVTSLNKSGADIWVLTAANTYTGTTTINTNGGTLLVNGVLAGAGAVTNNGGTLGGTGGINGAATMNTNALLYAGNGGIGTLTFSNGLTLNVLSTNIFVVTTIGGASNSVAVIGGTFAPSNSVIEINTAGDIALGAGTNTLFNYTGSTISGSFNATPVFVTVQSGLATNAYIYDTGSKIELVVTNAASAPTYSGDASLSNLVVSSSEAMSPTFSSGVTNYYATNYNTASTVTVLVTNNSALATNVLYLNGVAQATNAYTLATTVPVGVGNTNQIIVVVTAQDGVTTSTNTVTVTRLPSSDASLSFLALNPLGALSPPFATGTTNYTATNAIGTTSVTVTVTNTSLYATNVLFLNGVAQATNAYALAESVPVLVGSGNVIQVVVTAQDGVTTGTNTVMVTVLPSTNAYLISLVLSPAGLTSTFGSNTLSYLATNAYGNTPTVTVVNGDLTATNRLIYNNATNGLASGSASAGLALTLGVTNVAQVQVTAQDGVTVQTYQVNIVEQPSQTVPHLTNSVSGGTNLALSWPADHLGYRLLVQTNNLNKGVSGNINDWGTVPGTATITTTNIAIIKAGVTNEYYKLVYP